MPDTPSSGKSLRERIGGNAEERVGKALSELLESPLFTSAVGRAFDAREKAAQAQEVALGALNLPSAADIERLTRRLRSVTHRLEGIEEGVDRIDSSLSTRALEARLSAIEQQLQKVLEALDRLVQRGERPHAGASPAPALKPRAATKARADTNARTDAKARAVENARAGEKARAGTRRHSSAGGRAKAPDAPARPR